MAFLRGCYDQVVGPSRHLPKFTDRLCRHPDVWVRLHAHLIWQATESYVEGGNAFGLVFHLGFLTRLGLTAEYRRQHLDLLFILPEIMAPVVAVVAVVVAGAAV